MSVLIGTNVLSQLNRPVIVASHPRSGTHLTLDLIRRQFPACEKTKSFFSMRELPYINLDEILCVDKKFSDSELRYLNRSTVPLKKHIVCQSLRSASSFYLNFLCKDLSWLNIWSIIHIEFLCIGML